MPDKLKAVVKDISTVPEAFRPLYTQVGEDFILDIDDGEYKTKISEFRDNNIELTKKLQGFDGTTEELEKLKKQLETYDGIDAEAAREALKQAELLADKKLLDEGKLDELIQQRTERMRKDYEGKITALEAALEKTTSELTTHKTKLTEVVIDNSLQQAISSVSPIKQGAMQDALARGRLVFSLDDNGEPVPTGPDGNTMYGTDGKSPITMKEWAASLLEEAPYLFESSGGGGGQGNQHQGGGDGKTVNINDQDAINSNLEGIASGEVTVSEN